MQNQNIHPLKLRLTAERLTALLENIHQSMYGIEDERAVEANTLIGWAGDVALELKEGLDALSTQQIKTTTKEEL